VGMSERVSAGVAGLLAGAGRGDESRISAIARSWERLLARTAVRAILAG